MLSGWLVYLIVKLDTIRAMSLVFGISGGVVLALLGLVYAIFRADGKSCDGFKKPFKYTIIIFIISTIMITAVPTTKEASAIYMLPKIINNEHVQKLPENVVKLLNSKLEKWISDTVGETLNTETKLETEPKK